MDVSPSICPRYHINGRWEGDEGHVATGDTPHMFPSGVARPAPPSFQPCLGVLNQLQQPPAPNSAEEGHHPLFRALKRLQGPALLTRGDMVPVPASPVCPSPSAVAAPAKLVPGSRLTRWMLGSRQRSDRGALGLGEWERSLLKESPACGSFGWHKDDSEGILPGQTCPAEGQRGRARWWYVPIVPELWVQSGPHGLGCVIWEGSSPQNICA